MIRLFYLSPLSLRQNLSLPLSRSLSLPKSLSPASLSLDLSLSMEQPIERQLHNLSVSMEEPMEKQFARVLSLPFQQTEKEQKFQNIRITLYSRFLEVVDEVAAAVVSDAKEMHLRVCGPTVLPNQVSYITTRLCAGEYHVTRDFALQLYGRAIDVLSSTEVVEQIMSDCDDHFVKMEFEVVDLKLVQA